MKNIKIGMSLLLLLTMLVMPLMTSCGISLGTTKDGITKVKDYDINVTGGGDAVVSLVKGAEDTACSLVSETKTGKTIGRAWQVLSDGTKELIADVREFELNAKLTSIEVELVDAEPVVSVTFANTSYTGYYFGYNYSFNIAATVYPESAETYVKYFSSNTRVAKVNDRGRVTVVGAGSATISAISLNGGLKATFSVKIKNASSSLRDTSEEVLPTEYKLSGNRYDEISAQESVFDKIAYSPRSGFVIVAGYAFNDNKNFHSIISYGLPLNEDANFNGRFQIDPADEYPNDYISDVDYSIDSNCFYCLAQVSASDFEFQQTLLTTITETYNNVLDKYILSANPNYVMDKINGEYPKYESMALGEGIIYVAGSVGENGVVAIYDNDNNLVDYEIIEEFDTITGIELSSDGSTLLIVGTNSKGVNTFACYNVGTKAIVFGHSSTIGNATIVDAAFVSEDGTVIAAASNGTVGEKRVSEIQLFVYNESLNRLDSTNYYRLEDSEGHEFATTKLLFNYGVISVVGYEIEEVSTGILKLGKESRSYGTIQNLTTDLLVMNSRRYVNSDKKGGNYQQFLDALLLPNGELIAVGCSTYANPDTKILNGYIQRKLPFEYEQK